MAYLTIRQEICQAYPLAGEMLRRYSISIAQIAAATRCTQPAVRRALTGRPTHRSTGKAVREAVEQLLAALGERVDRDALWAAPQKIEDTA